MYYIRLIKPFHLIDLKDFIIINNLLSKKYFGNTIPRHYDKATGGKVTVVDISQVIAQRLFKLIFIFLKKCVLYKNTWGTHFSC